MSESDAAILEPPAPTAAELPSESAELAAGFIHEIKNHLGTLSLNLQLLAEDFETAQTPRERRALERVSRLSGECRKLVELSNDFLRFARLRELHAKPTTLDAVVSRMIDFLAPTARQRGVEINWFPAPDLSPVCLDCDLFEQALLNLMLNAEQAMPDGGALTLIGRTGGSLSAENSVRKDQDKDGAGGGEGGEPDAPLSSTHTHTAWVYLDVIDNGVGIAPEALAKLFRPFYTTKPDGNGLGLATTRKIVIAHGGAIEVQSTPGRGTKFTIALPAAPETGV
jgi:signal transduction histidine kinase